MKILQSWDEIPNLESEEDEALFWQHHQLDAALMNHSIVANESRDSTTITLRFDPRQLSRIKRIARSRFLNYQSMIKQWLAERIEDETRKM